jgi:hypothetical protein
MTPDRDDPQLPAEDEERVRRALAASAASGPVPDDVAARLDEVLAGLVAERGPSAPGTGGAGSPDVKKLGERRRRRPPQLLVAAALLAVVAVGVGTVVRSVGGSGSADSSSAGGQKASSQDRSTAGGSTESLQDAPAPVGPLPRLHSSSLPADVARLVEGRRARALTNGSAEVPRAPSRTGCVLPAEPTGTRVIAVRLDGRRATLVLSSPHRGVREATVYSCGDATVIGHTKVHRGATGRE